MERSGLGDRGFSSESKTQKTHTHTHTQITHKLFLPPFNLGLSQEQTRPKVKRTKNSVFMCLFSCQRVEDHEPLKLQEKAAGGGAPRCSKGCPSKRGAFTPPPPQVTITHPLSRSLSLHISPFLEQKFQAQTTFYRQDSRAQLPGRGRDQNPFYLGYLKRVAVQHLQNHC